MTMQFNIENYNYDETGITTGSLVESRELNIMGISDKRIAYYP